MNTFNVKARSIMSFAAAAVLGCVVASSAFARSGTSGEGNGPGANCPAGSYGYKAPPYIGTVYGKFSGDTIILSGSVEQVGSTTCAGNVAAEDGVAIGSGVTLEAFQATTARDVAGKCIVGLNATHFPCELDPQLPPPQTQYMEVVGAKNLKFIGGDLFSVDVVMMPVILR